MGEDKLGLPGLLQGREEAEPTEWPDTEKGPSQKQSTLIAHLCLYLPVIQCFLSLSSSSCT